MRLSLYAALAILVGIAYPYVYDAVYFILWGR